MQERTADVFGTAGAPSSEPPVDLKALHAKIGQLSLENDFLPDEACVRNAARNQIGIMTVPNVRFKKLRILSERVRPPLIRARRDYRQLPFFAVDPTATGARSRAWR